MVQDVAFAARYDAPAWAEASDPDDQAVIHSRRVGAVIDLDGGELAVDVVRRDEICMLDGVIGLVREPVWVRVAGVRIALDQVSTLARLLASASEITEDAGEMAKQGCS